MTLDIMVVMPIWFKTHTHTVVILKSIIKHMNF